MSMLSAQIDKLRKLAEYYDGSEVASIMRYAADTIWQLRDDLQRTNAVLQDVEHDESVAWDRARKAEAEAERLREQIVRCRDCKHYADHEWVIATDVSDVCHFWANGVKVEPDGFCKWGERRADA